jgi:RimJ/RimL family protein N-acetyltransferase
MSLSFKVVTEENLSLLHRMTKDNLPTASEEDLVEIFGQLEENLDDGCEYALSHHGGCLLMRIYEGEYLFAYPIALEDSANEAEAIEKIRRYAVKEEIPLVFCDVPAEALSLLISSFRHATVDAADRDREFFTVRIATELSLAEEIPFAEDGELCLCALKAEDEKKYAVLCRDEETNRYWGYDYRLDYPNADDGNFLEIAENELKGGVALSLAVRYRGELCGEAVLYSFDLLGGAQCAVRILPEYRRRGLARGALNLLSKIAVEMGLISISATVDVENTPSVNLFSALFDRQTKDGKNIVFIKDL